MTRVHVHRAKDQPATRYVVELGDHRFTVINRRRTMLPCFRCRRKRRAANLFVHAYYDGTYFFCKPGKGCKA